MPSQVMQNVIDGLRERRRAAAGQVPPRLAERRATFAPGGTPHPVPDDVLVTDVTAAGCRPTGWTPREPTPGGCCCSCTAEGLSSGRFAPTASSRPGWGGPAGGGLAVALLVAIRDAGEAPPAAAVLMSPTVDLTSSGASMTERVDQDPRSTPAMLRQFAADYLAGADPRTPLASPLFAPLAGLPPLLVLVGTADLLLSDSERLAAAADQAGVDVTLEIGDGLPHVYPIMLGTPEAAEATEEIGKFLRARVG